MADENVVQLPTVLERLAKRLSEFLKREATNKTEWIEIQEGICCTLAEARAEINADVPFGQWCEDNGFGDDKISHQTRADAIRMGNDPDALRACLQATERRSLRMIYQYDFQRFTSGGKPPSRRRKTEKTKVQEVAEHIRSKVEAGEAVSRAKVADEMDVGERVVEIARERELGRLQGLAERPPMTRAEMSKTMGERYEAALRKARVEIREELRAEVYAEMNSWVAHWKGKIELSEKIIASARGIISRDVFNLIRACLHPDHNRFGRAGEAFDTFIKLEKVLVKPDPPPLPAGVPPLPSSTAELMARRRTQRR